jgi:hypothetical protein
VNQSTDFAVRFAMLKAGVKRKPKLSAADFVLRFTREKALQQKRYCDALTLWRTCGRMPCRRRSACDGDANACLKRALDRVPHNVQWRARQDILMATPANIGAPERKARQCMPRDLYE